MRYHSIAFLIIIFLSCNTKGDKDKPTNNSVSLVVLGTVQDAGSPHIACKKACCSNLFLNPDIKRQVVSLGIIDHENELSFLFEATPDMPKQIKKLQSYLASSSSEVPSGVFLTHAHIGHYAGLMYFGKEAMFSSEIPIYTMPKMKIFLENNGPWNQLVLNKNISLNQISENTAIILSNNLKVIPYTVPHRDEYSETVGYKIIGPNKTILFIPDIDKWGKWNKNISEEIKNVDYAFLDATFFDGEEINNRDISEIPHPFVIESMNRFNKLNVKDRNKVFFIHFNHTNPLLNSESAQHKIVIDKGYNVSKINDLISL